MRPPSERPFELGLPLTPTLAPDLVPLLPLCARHGRHASPARRSATASAATASSRRLGSRSSPATRLHPTSSLSPLASEHSAVGGSRASKVIPAPRLRAAECSAPLPHTTPAHSASTVVTIQSSFVPAVAPGRA